MKNFALFAGLAALALSACAKTQEGPYSLYTVKDEGVSLEVPHDWTHFGARWNGLGGAPIGPAFTRFIAESQPQHEGIILGAYLSLTRLKKKEQNTDSEDMLFSRSLPGVEPAAFAGFEARAYVKEYRFQVPAGLRGGIDIPMRSEGIVINTPAAYFVLEYRANTHVYDRYRGAFDHAKKTLALPKG